MYYSKRMENFEKIKVPLKNLRFWNVHKTDGFVVVENYNFIGSEHITFEGRKHLVFACF